MTGCDLLKPALAGRDRSRPAEACRALKARGLLLKPPEAGPRLTKRSKACRDNGGERPPSVTGPGSRDRARAGPGFGRKGQRLDDTMGANVPSRSRPKRRHDLPWPPYPDVTCRGDVTSPRPAQKKRATGRVPPLAMRGLRGACAGE